MSAACPRCARRGFLLAALAGHVEKAVGARAGERSRDLLALDDERLAKALAPDDWRRRLVEADQAAANVAAVEGWSACAHSTPLPEALAVLGASAPRAIFGRGDPGLLAGVEPERAVTIVGSRRAGAYGREVAFELARALAGAGIVVVSGLALGIDAAAHEGALAGSGRTLAVLGPGADRAYPRSAHGLYRRVLADGAVVSELAPGAPTFRWVFPARNRLMAALSGITVVVEAAGRSGSLITAEMAIDCGRAVGAVPGPVNSWRSSGTNQLLADGAAVVRDARDVLDALLGPGAVVASPPGPRLDPAAAAVLDAVEAGAATPDAIAGASGLDLQPALRALAALERGGYVSGDHAGRWSRTMQPAPAGEPRAAATAA
ncbi:MAG TPA: DNA-processing protein DprA [Solirubrobacterales bacterium]|nr:DNA-processing protein DprA [Solirubrobacterales bacterium]